jgi:hypothetical protein
MQAQPELDRFTQDALYLDRRRQELLERYPDQWVAIYQQTVVGAAKNPERLVRQLERKGIPSGQTYWEYLSTKDELLIVPTFG